MSDSLRQQIYNNQNQKTNEELLEIWIINDRAEWSGTTFEVIQQILAERGLLIPPQNEAILSHEAAEKEHIGQELPDDETDAPVFYKPQTALQLIQWLEWAAKASLVIVILSGFVTTWPIVGMWFRIPTFPNAEAVGLGMSLGMFVVSIFSAAITYLTLRATAYILKILMEFEFNSRGVR